MELERRGGLVIGDRPQVSVEIVGKFDMEITVSRIADDFSMVETTTIVFPVECAREIAKAMLGLLKSK